MTEWKTVHGNVDPGTLDTTSSRYKVYEYRNVQTETITDEDGNETTGYVYEMRKYSRAEYEAMTAPAQQAVMQAISELELAVAMI